MDAYSMIRVRSVLSCSEGEGSDPSPSSVPLPAPCHGSVTGDHPSAPFSMHMAGDVLRFPQGMLPSPHVAGSLWRKEGRAHVSLGSAREFPLLLSHSVHCSAPVVVLRREAWPTSSVSLCQPPPRVIIPGSINQGTFPTAQLEKCVITLQFCNF